MSVTKSRVLREELVLLCGASGSPPLLNQITERSRTAKISGPDTNHRWRVRRRHCNYWFTEIKSGFRHSKLSVGRGPLVVSTVSVLFLMRDHCIVDLGCC